jgi:hypothetical protein
LREVLLTLEIPESVTLPDRTIAHVKRVDAKVIDGRVTQVVYTVEKASGAWVQVPAEEAGVPAANS